MRRVARSVITREELHPVLLTTAGEQQTKIVSAFVEMATQLVVQELPEGEQADFLGRRGRYEPRASIRPADATARSPAGCAPRRARSGWRCRRSSKTFRDTTGELLISRNAVSEITDRLWDLFRRSFAWCELGGGLLAAQVLPAGPTRRAVRRSPPSRPHLRKRCRVRAEPGMRAPGGAAVVGCMTATKTAGVRSTACRSLIGSHDLTRLEYRRAKVRTVMLRDQSAVRCTVSEILSAIAGGSPYAPV